MMFPCCYLPWGKKYNKMYQAALFFLSLFLFVSPFPHTQTIGDICFYLAFLIFLYFFFRFGIRVEKHDVWVALLLFGCWAIISSILAFDPAASFADFYSHFIKYLFLTIMLVGFGGSRQGMIRWAWIVVVSAVVFSLVIMVFFYGVLGHNLSVRLGEGLGRWPINPMGFVMLFSLALIPPLYLHGSQHRSVRNLLVCAVIILVAAAILTQSRGTLIGLMLVVCVSFWRYKKILVGVLLFVIVFAVSATPIVNRFSQEDKARKALILYTIEVIKDHPVSGIGFSLDTFKDTEKIDPAHYAARIPEPYRNVVVFLWPHNMFLDVAVRTGLIGMVLFCIFLGLMFLEIVRLLRHASECFVRDWALALLAALSMFVVKGVVEPVTMHLVEVVFYTILGMVVIMVKVQRGFCSHASAVANSLDATPSCLPGRQPNSKKNGVACMPGEIKLRTKLLYKLLLKLFKPDLVCDVGSMDASEALSFARLLPASHIVLFEANPVNFDAIQSNPEVRQYGLELVNKAVWYENGSLPFYIEKPSPVPGENEHLAGMSSTRLRNNKLESLKNVQVNVESVRLDTIINAKQPKPASIALWIDVEGAAYEVLQGIRDIVDRVVLIHVEVETREFWQGQKLKTEVLALAWSLGFIPVGRGRNEEQHDLVLVNNSVLCRHRLVIHFCVAVVRLCSLNLKAGRRLIRELLLGRKG